MTPPRLLRMMLNATRDNRLHKNESGASRIALRLIIFVTPHLQNPEFVVALVLGKSDEACQIIALAICQEIAFDIARRFSVSRGALRENYIHIVRSAQETCEISTTPIRPQGPQSGRH